MRLPFTSDHEHKWVPIAANHIDVTRYDYESFTWNKEQETRILFCCDVSGRHYQTKRIDGHWTLDELKMETYV